jgi:hypothetical protein
MYHYLTYPVPCDHIYSSQHIWYEHIYFSNILKYSQISVSIHLHDVYLRCSTLEHKDFILEQAMLRLQIQLK